MDVWVVVAVFSEEFPVAVLRPVRARPAPRLATTPVVGTRTTEPPLADTSMSWTRVVSEMFPDAVASPLQAQASPSDSFSATPLEEAMALPSRMSPSTVTVSVCVSVALLSDSLPMAVLSPVSATPSPPLITSAVCGVRISPRPLSASTFWWTCVVDSLPEAVALPVPTLAEPSDVLVASPAVELMRSPLTPRPDERADDAGSTGPAVSRRRWPPCRRWPVVPRRRRRCRRRRSTPSGPARAPA